MCATFTKHRSSLLNVYGLGVDVLPDYVYLSSAYQCTAYLCPPNSVPPLPYSVVLLWYYPSRVSVC